MSGADNLLRALFAGNGDDTPGEDKPTRLSHEVQFMRLREASERYINPQVFEVGQLVTPRAESTNKWVGEPHLVIDTNYSGEPVWHGEPHSHGFGMRPEVRVLVMVASHNGDKKRAHLMTTFWGESADYEPYTPPVDKPQVPEGWNDLHIEAYKPAGKNAKH
jgi:hypothetical protein